MTQEQREKYSVMQVSPRHKPMTQQVMPRAIVVIVTNKKTGKQVAVDYERTSHKNLVEAIRLHEKEELELPSNTSENNGSIK